MVNIQEQVKIGFNRISSELRSLSSSVPPRQRISQLKRKSIERRPASIEKDCSSDEPDDLEADNEEEIEEINPQYEDSSSDGEREYEDSKLQEEAQKDLVKRKRKEIRVNFVIMLCLHNLNCKN